MGNYNEFTFPFSQTWWIVLMFTLGVVVIASAIIASLPNRVMWILNMVAFSFGLCFYIQMMAFNGKMQSFTGDNIVFDGRTKTMNLLLWIVIAAAVIVICRVGLRRGTLPIIRKILVFASFAFVFIQSAGFVSSAASLPKSDILKQGYFSSIFS